MVGKAKRSRRPAVTAKQPSQAAKAMMLQVLRARFEQVTVDLEEQKTEWCPDRGRSNSKV